MRYSTSSTQPCPRCQAVGSPAAPATGTCDRGARAGLTCLTTNSGGLSADCVPGGTDGSSDLGSIPVDLTPLITGTASDMRTTLAALVGLGRSEREPRGCFVAPDVLDSDVAAAFTAAASRLTAPADARTRADLLDGFRRAPAAYNVITST